MPVEYSRRELAQRLARSPTDVARASGRIQHWTEKGLFAVLGEKHVGRGRARRYPKDALWLAAFYDHCADRAATVGQMGYWATPLQILLGRERTKTYLAVLAEKHPRDAVRVAAGLDAESRPIDAAIAGHPMYLMIREPAPFRFENFEKFGEKPDLPPDWPGASVFNLTAIFDRVRS